MWLVGARAGQSRAEPAVITAPGPGGARATPVRAAPIASGPAIDGRLDDAAWAGAAPFDDFVQLAPAEGGAPSERTELRVVYDRETVYVAVTAHDRDPAGIIHNLGRRDSDTASDAVTVFIDSKEDDETAYVFQVTAAGVLSDRLVFHDEQETGDWDVVWRAAALRGEGGWTAEIAIPLRALRFPRRTAPRWGFTVERLIARKHELVASHFRARSAPGIASGLGTLEGLVELQPRRSLEVAPYVSLRGIARPQYADPARSSPRLGLVLGDVGLDAHWALSRHLDLIGTINPDFSQVEADEILLNLTTLELFFPEKRPFFNRGMELFQPIDPVFPHQLFYSRRIGLDAPIAGAARLTGTVGKFDVGVLDALVVGAWQEDDEASPDRSYGFHLAQPLHLGPNHDLPDVEPVPRNFLAAAGRGELAPGVTVGALATSAIPLAGSCTADDAAAAEPPTACRGRGGNAASVDVSMRSSNGQWQARGQATGSHAFAGPPSVVLLDGTRLRRGDLGAGAAVTAGKLGGEPFRFSLHYDHTSPRLDVNASGFQQVQNNQDAVASVSFVRPAGVGALHELGVTGLVEVGLTADDRQLRQFTLYRTSLHTLLPGYVRVDCRLDHYDGGFDPYAIPGTGSAFEQGDQDGVRCDGNSDESQPLVVTAEGSLARVSEPLREASTKWSISGGLAWRPVTWLRSELTALLADSPQGIRFTAEEDERLLFADLDSRQLSLTLRQELVLAPTMTVQVYGQLFSAYGAYGQAYSAPTGLDEVRRADLMPVADAPDPSFKAVDLNAQVVFRWEYRLGSAFYALYSRSQQAPPSAAASLGPGQLGSGPATDTIAIKLSYLWDL